MGYTITTFGNISLGQIDKEKWLQRIQSATAYLITDSGVVGSPEFANEVKAQVQAGKRLVCLAPPPFQALNTFLLEFYIAFSRKKLAASTPAPATLSDGRALVLQEENQENLLARHLMSGSSEITAGLPCSVWYGKDATPLFVPNDDAKVISKADYFEEIDVRKVACAAVWPAGRSSDHRVIALGGDFVRNPFQDASGEIHPGLAANRRFARNLILWMVKVGEQANNVIDYVTQLIHSVEVSLWDVVKAVLTKEYGDKWWSSGLPLDVRKKAATLAEEGGTPKESCLHFVDLKIVVEKQWRCFEKILGPASNQKRETLERLQRLNDLRNRISHPMRLKHEPIEDGEVKFVESELRFLKQVFTAHGLAEAQPKL